MFKALMGGGRSSSDVRSSSSSKSGSRRKSGHHKSSASSTVSRKSSRGDDRDRGLGDLSAYPTSGGRSWRYADSVADESVASSYATAQPNYSEDRISVERTPKRREFEYDERDDRYRDDRDRDRNRVRRRARSEREDSRDRDSRRRECERMYSGDAYFPPVASGGVPAPLDPVQTTQDPSQSPFPMNLVSGPTDEVSPSIYDPHVQQQFPGQFPNNFAEPYRPPNPAGEAADYYNDQGQSVAEQPGVRPKPPLVIPNSQTHLMTASPTANPPPEPSSVGEVGAAAAYFANDPVLDSQMPGQPVSGPESRPPRPSNSSQPSGHATAGAFDATGAAATYGVGDYKPEDVLTESPSAYAPPGNKPPHSHSHSHSHSHGVGAAVGGSVAGAAAGYMLGHHHHSSSGSDNVSQYTMQNPDDASQIGAGYPGPSANPAPYAAGAAGAAGAAYASNPLHPHHAAIYHGSPFQGGAMAYQQRQRGPLDKFIDFWRDPEGVGRFEDYTEAIGVCKYCFDPGTSSRDAPRPHHYRRRRSSDRISAGSRVDKLSRYASSEDESRRRKSSKKSWIPAILGGYAVKSLFDNKDFDDSYSVKSGQFAGAYPDSESSTSDKRSRTSRGVYKRSYRSDSQERTHRADYPDQRARAYEGSRNVARSRSRSRSSSRSNHHTLRNAAIGAAVGTAAASMAKSRHRDRSRSHSPSRSSRKARGRKSSSSSDSSLDNISRPAKKSTGGFGSFFTASSENRNKRRNKRSKSIFSFNNSSSSSLDNDLAFGSGYAKKLIGKSKRRGSKEKKGKDVDAKLLALGATATALAASSPRRNRRAGEVFAGQGSRSGRSDYTSSASNDEDWEDLDSEGQASSVSSALAFGSSGNLARDESHSSDSSSSGWRWGWGTKKKSKRKSSSTDNRFSTGAAVAAGALGTAALGSGYHRDANARTEAPSSSTGSLQHVAPMPTSDPGRYDAIPVSSFPPSQPQLVRPGPIPLQQPQPVTPVSQAVYTSQGAPIIPAFESPFPSYESQLREVEDNQRTRDSLRASEVPKAERRHRRSDSTPLSHTEPLESIPDPGLKRRSTTRDQGSVQFNLTREQEDKQQRTERLERLKHDLGRRDGIQLIDREDDAKSAPAGYSSQRYREREPERKREREWEPERERESERRFVKEDDLKRDKDSASWAGPVMAGVAGAAVASTVLSGRSSKDDASETSERWRERSEQRRAERRRATDPPSVSSASYKYSDRPEPREIIEERATSTSPSDHVKTSAFRGVADKKSVYDDYAAFFYPEELRHSPDSHGRRETPTMPTIIEIEPATETSRQQSYEPQESYQEPPSDYKGIDRLPWPVPVLKVIEPTPPHSVSGSVRDTSPIITPSEPPEAEREPERPTGSRVSWGEHQTHEYEVPSTSSERSSIDLNQGQRDFAPETATRDTPIGYSYIAQSDAAVEDPNEEIEFAATVAAAAQAAGFDPSLVTDDPAFRARTSPPGSDIRERSISPTTKVPLHPEQFHGYVEGALESPEAPKSQFFSDQPIFTNPKPAVSEGPAERGWEFEPPSSAEQPVVEHIDRVYEEPVDRELPRSITGTRDAQEKPASEGRRQVSESPGEEEFFMPGGFETEEAPQIKHRSTSPIAEDVPRDTVSYSANPEPENEPLRRSETEGTETGIDDIPESIAGGDDGSEGKKRRKKVKRRSKRESETFDDTASVASSALTEGSGKPRSADDKGKKSGGFLSSLFGSRVSEPVESKRSSETPVPREAQSEIGPRTSDESKRRRRHRSSSRGDSLDESRRYDDSELGREDSFTADKENVNVESYKSSRQRREDRRRQRQGGSEYEKEPRTSQVSDRNQSFLVERPEMPQMDDGGESDGASGPSSSRDAEERGLEQRFNVRRSRSHSTSPPSSQKVVTDSAPRSISPGPALERDGGGFSRSRRPSMLRFADSPTAVPLQFRQPPTSPRLQRSPSISSSTAVSPSSPSQGRRSRPNSSEFKSSREIRPLFLVERHGSSKIESQLHDEPLPSLPSSKSASTEDLTVLPDENNWESSGFSVGTKQPTEEYSCQQEVPGSQQNTPTRATFGLPRHLSRKEELGYEFHSPSELLQESSSYPDLPPSPTLGSIPSVEASAVGVSDDEGLESDFESLPPLPDSRPSTPEDKAVSASDAQQTTPTQEKSLPIADIPGLYDGPGFAGVVDAAVAASTPGTAPFPDVELLAKSEGYDAEDDDGARTVTGDDVGVLADISPPDSPFKDAEDPGTPVERAAPWGFASVVDAAVAANKEDEHALPRDFPVTTSTDYGKAPESIADTTEDEFFDAMSRDEVADEEDTPWEMSLPVQTSDHTVGPQPFVVQEDFQDIAGKDRELEPEPQPEPERGAAKADAPSITEEKSTEEISDPMPLASGEGEKSEDALAFEFRSPMDVVPEQVHPEETPAPEEANVLEQVMPSERDLPVDVADNKPFEEAQMGAEESATEAVIPSEAPTPELDQPAEEPRSISVPDVPVTEETKAIPTDEHSAVEQPASLEPPADETAPETIPETIESSKAMEPEPAQPEGPEETPAETGLSKKAKKKKKAAAAAAAEETPVEKPAPVEVSAPTEDEAVPRSEEPVLAKQNLESGGSSRSVEDAAQPAEQPASEKSPQAAGAAEPTDTPPEQSSDQFYEVEDIAQEQIAVTNQRQDSAFESAPAPDETPEGVPESTVDKKVEDLEADGAVISQDNQAEEPALPAESVPTERQLAEAAISAEQQTPETEQAQPPDQEAREISTTADIAAPLVQSEISPETNESKQEDESAQPEPDALLSRKPSKKNRKKNKRKDTAEALPEPETADTPQPEPEAPEKPGSEAEAGLVLDEEESKLKEQEDIPGDSKDIVTESVKDEEAPPEAVSDTVEDSQAAPADTFGRETEAIAEEPKPQEQEHILVKGKDNCIETDTPEPVGTAEEPQPVSLPERTEDVVPEEPVEDQQKTKGKKKNRKFANLTEQQPQPEPETKPEDVAAAHETSGQLPPPDDSQQQHHAGTEGEPTDPQVVDTIPENIEDEPRQSVEIPETNDSKPHAPEQPTIEPEAGEQSPTGKKSKKKKKKKNKQSVSSNPEESSLPDVVEAPETETPTPAMEAAPGAPVESPVAPEEPATIPPEEPAEMSRDVEQPAESGDAAVPDDQAASEATPMTAAQKKKAKKDKKKKRQSLAPEVSESQASEAVAEKELSNALVESGVQEPETAKAEVEQTEAVTAVVEQSTPEVVEQETKEQTPEQADEQIAEKELSDKTATEPPVVADEPMTTEVQPTLGLQEDKPAEMEAPTITDEPTEPTLEDGPLEGEKARDLEVSAEDGAVKPDDQPGDEQPKDSAALDVGVPAVEPMEDTQEQKTEDPQANAEIVSETPTEEAQPMSSKKDKKKKKKRQSVSADEPEAEIATAQDADTSKSAAAPADLPTSHTPGTAEDTTIESAPKKGEARESQTESAGPTGEIQEAEKIGKVPVPAEATSEPPIEQEPASQDRSIPEFATETSSDQPAISQQEDVVPSPDDQGTTAHSLPEEPTPHQAGPQEEVQEQPAEEMTATSKKKSKKKKKKSQSTSVDEDTPAPVPEEPVPEQAAEPITETAVTAEPEEATAAAAAAVEEPQPSVDESTVLEPKEAESQDVAPAEEEPTKASKKKAKKDKKKRKSVSFATEESPEQQAGNSEPVEPVEPAEPQVEPATTQPAEATEPEPPREVPAETEMVSEQNAETEAEQGDQRKLEEPTLSEVPNVEASPQEQELKAAGLSTEAPNILAPDETNAAEGPEIYEEARAESMPQSMTETTDENLEKGRQISADQTPSEELLKDDADISKPEEGPIPVAEAEQTEPLEKQLEQIEPETGESTAPTEQTTEPETGSSKKDKKKKKRKTLELKEDVTTAPLEPSENVQEQTDTITGPAETKEVEEPAPEPEKQDEDGTKSAKAKKKAKKDKKRQSKLLAFENEPSTATETAQDPSEDKTRDPETQLKEAAPGTSEGQQPPPGPETPAETAISPAEEDGKENPSHDTELHGGTDKELTWTDNDVSSQVEKEQQQTVSTDPLPEHESTEADPKPVEATTTEPEVVEEIQDDSTKLEPSDDAIVAERGDHEIEGVPGQEVGDSQIEEYAQENKAMENEAAIEPEKTDDKDLSPTIPDVAEPVEEQIEEAALQPTTEAESARELVHDQPAAEVDAEEREPAVSSRKLSKKQKKKQRQAEKTTALQDQEKEPVPETDIQEAGDSATVEEAKPEPTVSEGAQDKNIAPEDAIPHGPVTEATTENASELADSTIADTKLTESATLETFQDTTSVPEETPANDESSKVIPDDSQQATDLPRLEEQPSEPAVSDLAHDTTTLFVPEGVQNTEANEAEPFEAEPTTTKTDAEKDESPELLTETIKEDEPVASSQSLPVDEGTVKETLSLETPEDVVPAIEEDPLTGKSKKKNKQNKKNASTPVAEADNGTSKEPLVASPEPAVQTEVTEDVPKDQAQEPAPSEITGQKEQPEVVTELEQVPQVQIPGPSASEPIRDEEQPKVEPEATTETSGERSLDEPSVASEEPLLSRKESKKKKKKAKKQVKEQEQLEEPHAPAGIETGTTEDTKPENVVGAEILPAVEPVAKSTEVVEPQQVQSEQSEPVEAAAAVDNARLDMTMEEPVHEEVLVETEKEMGVPREDDVQEKVMDEAEKEILPEQEAPKLEIQTDVLEPTVEEYSMQAAADDSRAIQLESAPAPVSRKLSKKEKRRMKKQATSEAGEKEQQETEAALEPGPSLQDHTTIPQAAFEASEAQQETELPAVPVEEVKEASISEPPLETTTPKEHETEFSRELVDETSLPPTAEDSKETTMEPPKEVDPPTRKLSKKEKKKRKGGKAEEPQPESEQLAEPTSLPEERPVDKTLEPNEARQTELTGHQDEDAWPPIDWAKGKIDTNDQSSQSSVEAHAGPFVPEIPEFKESAIPEALLEQPGETPQEAAKESKAPATTETTDRDGTTKDFNPTSANSELEQLHQAEYTGERKVEEPKPSKIASIFPNLERGFFRRPSLTQSVKDGAEEETVEPEASRDSAIQVLEAPIARDVESQPVVRDSGYIPSPTLAQEDVFGATAKGIPDAKAELTLERPPETFEPESRSTEQTDVLEPVEKDDVFGDTSTRELPNIITDFTGERPADLPVREESRSIDQDGIPVSVPTCDLRRSPSIHGRHDHPQLPWSLDEPAQAQSEREISPPMLPPITEQEPERSMVRDGTPRLEMKPEHVLPRTQTPVRKFTENALGRQAWPTPDNSDDDWEKVQKPSPQSLSPERGLRSEILKTPEQNKPLLRPSRPGSANSSTQSLRRIVHSASGDLRAAALAASQAPAPAVAPATETERQSRPTTPQPSSRTPTDLNVGEIASSSSYDPVTDKGKKPVRSMTDVYEGWGETPSSPRSPSRPASVRHRRSMQHLQELEFRLEHLIQENRDLVAARDAAEGKLRNASLARRKSDQALNTRDADLRDREAELDQLQQSVEWFQKEVSRLNEENTGLTTTNAALIATHTQEIQKVQQNSAREVEQLRSQNERLSSDLHERIKSEIEIALRQKNAELRRLREELESARDKVKELQQQISASMNDNVISFRGEDYFEAACQKLCGHVQQWVLRFSKHSDHHRCRKLIEVQDEKLADRFDNAILDGSDTDAYLGDRVRRRDVFMSVVMTMVWEFVFTRYLFGMDREQRQKLKSLEKQLIEVGPRNSIHRWRATTLTLLSRRQAFATQREKDTEAVALEIFETLSRVLPPPKHVEPQLLDSLRKVLRVAVGLSLEMRTQLAEYIMLPPLQPEYDTNGDLARQVFFNASLMNERSGETTSNEELQSQNAIVRVVLFPLVVKKGNDAGEGDDEVVVCPAQVLVARPGKDKRLTKMTSGDRMSVEASRSVHSIAPSTMDMSMNMSMSNVI